VSDARDDANEEDGAAETADDVTDEPVEADEEDEVDELDEVPRRRRSRKGADAPVRARELVLLAIAVLAIAGLVLFGLRWKDLHDAEIQRQDVETSASEFLNAMFTWDGATINEDFDRILSFATGDFEEEARGTFADDQNREDLAANQASERADDVTVFVQSIEGDDAEVFGVVQIRAANNNLPTPRADTVRVRALMTKVDGEWKIYRFDVLDGLSLGLPVEPDAPTTTVPEG
jgi:Mce-associated membrane protein